MAAFGRSATDRVETAQSIADAKAGSKFGSEYFVYPDDLSADYCFSILTKKYKFSVKKPKATENGTHYFLPLPTSITDPTGINYATPELGAIGGALAGIGMGVGQNLASAGSAREAGSIFTKSIAGIASSAMDAVKQADGASLAAAVNAGIGGSGAIGGTVSAFLGEIPNPNATAFFKGVSLKTHTFNWEMYPQSQQESTTLHKLINQLRKDSLPDRVGGTIKVGANVSPGPGAPPVKEVKISPFLTYPMEAHISITTKGAQNTILFKPAFIESININYAPGGVAFLENGEPAGVALSMTFKEQDIWTKSDYPSAGALQSAAADKSFG